MTAYRDKGEVTPDRPLPQSPTPAVMSAGGALGLFLSSTMIATITLSPAVGFLVAAEWAWAAGLTVTGTIATLLAAFGFVQMGRAVKCHKAPKSAARKTPTWTRCPECRADVPVQR